MRHWMVHLPKSHLEGLIFFLSIVLVTFGDIDRLLFAIAFQYYLNAQKNVVGYCYRQSNQHSEYNPAKQFTYLIIWNTEILLRYLIFKEIGYLIIWLQKSFRVLKWCLRFFGYEIFQTKKGNRKIKTDWSNYFLQKLY